MIIEDGKTVKPSKATTISDAHRRTIRSVRISPSGRLLATASFDGTTGLWSILKQPHDTLEDSCLATLEGHENEVKGIAWSPSGALLATCGRDKSVWIWEVIDESSTGGDPDFECIAVLQEHSQDVKCVEWHPTDEDLLASASYDDTIKLWRDDDGGDWFCADTLLGHTSTVWSLAFNAKGNKLGAFFSSCCNLCVETHIERVL
jgi:WD40 repeat protein